MTDINIVSLEQIEPLIHVVRGHKVMFDTDLAALYGVTAKRLNEQVKRNLKRFPPDFMFQLNETELKNLRSQFATSSWGGRRYTPYVFTEQGVAMLSSVLNSERAISVNVEIMRAFVKQRQFLFSHQELKSRIDLMEERFDAQFSVVFDALKEMMKPPDPNNTRPIGYAAWPKDEQKPKTPAKQKEEQTNE